MHTHTTFIHTHTHFKLCFVQYIEIKNIELISQPISLINKNPHTVSEIQTKADGIVSDLQSKGDELVSKLQDLINKQKTTEN